MRRRAAATILAGACAVAMAAPDVPFLVPGATVAGTLVGGERHCDTYRIDVDEGAFGIILRLRGSPVDVDLYARHGAPMKDWDDDPDARADSGEADEDLVLLREGAPPLQDGVVYLDVSLPGDAPPDYGNRRLTVIPYALQYVRMPIPAPRPLAAGSRCEGTLGTEEMMHAYTVDVPAGTVTLRLDLDGGGDDLDLYVRAGDPFLRGRDAAWLAVSRRSREVLIVEAAGGGPLEAGPYQVHIRSPWLPDRPLPYVLLATFAREAPPAMHDPPVRMSDAAAGWRGGLTTTVELMGASAAGSGVLVHPDGWVLTAAHVLDRTAPEREEVTIAVNLAPDLPPREMFLARVVESDEMLDLALLKIDRDILGAPLPPEYRFPFQRLGARAPLPEPGTQIWAVGYPDIGGYGSREPITVSRGIVAGYDRRGDLLKMKSDVMVAQGNSGGPVLDEEGQVQGIAVETFQLDGAPGYLSYIMPVSMIPEPWLAHLAPEPGPPGPR